MTVHLKVIGILLITLSLVHTIFPGYFKWSQELRSLQLFNRQVMYVHTFFIALTVFGMGLLCLTHPEELTGSGFGKDISLGLGIFWGIRLFFQLFVYSPDLWKGKSIHTMIHVLFTAFWLYMTFVFISIYV